MTVTPSSTTGRSKDRRDPLLRQTWTPHNHSSLLFVINDDMVRLFVSRRRTVISSGAALSASRQ